MIIYLSDGTFYLGIITFTKGVNLDQIEISRDGIKISYLRLISDSATGFLVILIIIYFYHMFALQQTPFEIPSEIKSLIPLNSSLEVKIFVLVLSFLLSTPLGLIISATSWFCLGWLEVVLVQLCVEENTWLKYLTEPTKKIYKYDEVSRYFGILDKNNFYQTSIYFETLLYVYFPDYVKSINYAIGCTRLLRSIALIDIILFLFLNCILNSTTRDFISIIIFILPIITITVTRILSFRFGNSELFTHITLILLSVIVLCNIFLIMLGFSVILFNICYLIFFFCIISSSLSEFYYSMRILYSINLLCDKDNCVSLEEHISRYKRQGLKSGK